MLVLGKTHAHQEVTDLPELLRENDLLVVNDTRVLQARLSARRSSGGKVEVLLLGPGPGPVEAFVKPGRRLKPAEILSVEGGGEIRLLERHPDGRWTVQTEPSPLELMQLAGTLPLPPYLKREADPSDAVRYQTIFAERPGAVAAPTAGLHLTASLVDALGSNGISVARITLHVGVGTFRPVRPEELESGLLHPEWYEVPSGTVEAIRRCRELGGRVIAVGTTSVRTLESATPEGPSRLPLAGEGVTRLFLREGHRFRCVDGLLTNFHLPRTSLLMLVCAFGGRERVLSAYREAVSCGYRFYSYGDAMLLLPA